MPKPKILDTRGVKPTKNILSGDRRWRAARMESSVKNFKNKQVRKPKSK